MSAPSAAAGSAYSYARPSHMDRAHQPPETRCAAKTRTAGGRRALTAAANAAPSGSPANEAGSHSARRAMTAGAACTPRSVRDDRVHPGHARKFAARLAEIGAPYLYYEQTFGGHANDADPALNARRWARHYVYLAQKLMD